jgi:spermidine synthase
MVLLLQVSFLLLGLSATITQVLFIREFLVVFYGNELCLGVILASWLVGISLGAFLAGVLIERIKNLAPCFLLSLIALSLLPPFQIHLIRILRSILDVATGEYIGLVPLLISSFVLILPFSFFIGFIFPFACRLLIKEGKSPAVQIGLVYIIEALGSVIGGLAVSLYLLARFPPLEICSFFALLLLANCFCLSLVLEKGATRVSMATLSLSFFFLYAWLLPFHTLKSQDELSVLKRWKTLNPQIILITSRESRYQNINLGRQETQYSLFGNGQWISSFPDDYQSASLAHFLLTEHPDPREVLLIGGGFEGMIKEVLKHPVVRLDYVELDTKLIETALSSLPHKDKKALKDKRVRMFYTDGRYLVKRTGERYDEIIINLPDPSTAMLNRYYTVDFFREVKRILKPDGILVIGVSSSSDYFGKAVRDYAGSVYDSLHKVFSSILISPGERNWFFASDHRDVATFNIDVLKERYLGRRIDSLYFSPYHFQLLLPKDRVEFVARAFQERTQKVVNTDLQPITYFYNLILWETFSGERGKRNLFQTLRESRWYWFFLPVILILCLRLLYLIFSQGSRIEPLRFNCLWAIGTTGFTGMALEIILIFSFQNIYGYIYQQVGVIVALFMLGLALGSYLMNRMISTFRVELRALISIECALVFYPLILPALVTIISRSFISEPYFMILVMIAGLLTGLEFPLVARLYLTKEGGSGKVAGMVDSADHLGACLGSLLTGTLFVPILGLKFSCLLIGALNLTSVTLLVMSLLEKRRAIKNY